MTNVYIERILPKDTLFSELGKGEYFTLDTTLGALYLKTKKYLGPKSLSGSFEVVNINTGEIEEILPDTQVKKVMNIAIEWNH